MSKKLAVVVVHGVADQQPSESARQIAGLLTDLRPLGTYSTFQEEKIRVPAEPLCTRDDEEIHRSPFEDRNRDAILRHRGTPPHIEPEHGFMSDQLRCYDPEEHPRVFETVRLDGRHTATQCGVHIYEAYWADLSRLGKGIVVFFGELYQLLLHLPSLGRTTVDYARAEDKGGRLWPLFSWWHRWSVRWLTLFIVVLNLVVASLILPAVAPRLTRISPSDPAASGTAAVEVLVIAIPALAFLTGVALLLRRRQPPALIWILAPVVAAAVGAGVGAFAARQCGAGRVLVFEAWLISAGGIALVLSQYDSMRRGARWVGVVALLITGAALLYFLRQDDGKEQALTHAVLHALQLANFALQVAWRIHVVWLLAMVFLGFLCRAAASKEWKARARNTIWTARTTLALSTAIFANLTLTLWAALFTGVQKILPPGDTFVPLAFKVLYRLGGDPASTTSEIFIQKTLMLSASRGFILITVVFGLFALAAIWSIFPSIAVESSPPKRQQLPRSRNLGVWLTRGLNAIPAAAEIFWLLLAAMVILALWNIPSSGKTSWTAISASATLIIALAGMRFWLPGASGALDVMLDVDNYLRQHPKDDTPRARIAERCTSLLRFILDPKRNGGHRYDGVIIVAHSQGTIIVADLLRYLRATGDPLSSALEATQPAFFTMGCPLRQLYARAFPGLYPWVWPDGSGATPQDLAVAEWVNAYCSGDYVGRVIWGDPAAPTNWDRNVDGNGDPVPTPIAANVRQMCTGEGAHTHYWDRFGHDVAWMLDELIVARCRGDA